MTHAADDDRSWVNHVFGALPAAEVAERMPAVTYVYDVKRRRSVHQNRPLASILGYGPEETARMGGEAWRLLIHPEDAVRFPAYRDALPDMADGETRVHEYRMKGADGRWRWLQSRDAPFRRDADGSLAEIIGTTADVSELKTAEARQALLARELNHRVRNMLMVVQSLLGLTLRTSPDPQSFAASFSGRIAALSAANDLVTRTDWDGAPFGELARLVLAPYDVYAQGRIALSGPHVSVAPGPSATLALAFHELATNAAKHGALSAPEGRVTLEWAEQGGSLAIKWREAGGPVVTLPTRQGFGSVLLEQALVRELKATCERTFAPEGLVCAIRVPLSALSVAKAQPQVQIASL